TADSGSNRSESDQVPRRSKHLGWFQQGEGRRTRGNGSCTDSYEITTTQRIAHSIPSPSWKINRAILLPHCPIDPFLNRLLLVNVVHGCPRVGYVDRRCPILASVARVGIYGTDMWIKIYVN